jgi:hypothetical protein
MGQFDVLIVRVKPNGTKEFRWVSSTPKSLNRWLSTTAGWRLASAAEKKEWEKKEK